MKLRAKGLFLENKNKVDLKSEASMQYYAETEGNNNNGTVNHATVLRTTHSCDVNSKKLGQKL